MSDRRRRRGLSRRLAVYTAATIIVGAIAFVWSVIAFPIDPEISLTVVSGPEGELLGVLFWILLGLLGSLRVQQLAGFGVLTFHFPFIIAATALGGPTAGAIVALVSTIEPRELRPSEVPWYGTLANHASLALSAIAGGVVMVVTREVAVVAGLADAQAVDLLAIVLGSLVFAVLATALVAGTIALRDGLTAHEFRHVFDSAYRTTAAAEVVLGWLLWLTYSSVGWWAALICAALVILVWRALEEIERGRLDPLTQLLRRRAFTEHLLEARRDAELRGHRGGILVIDLDGFKQVNDIHGHAAGDDVLVEVGARLRHAVRLTDAACRLGGDEFAILFTRVPDAAMLEQLAWRTHLALCKPLMVKGQLMPIGASIGVIEIDPDADEIPDILELLELADRAMYVAKMGGGGVCIGPVTTLPDQSAARERRTDRSDDPSPAITG